MIRGGVWPAFNQAMRDRLNLWLTFTSCVCLRSPSSSSASSTKIEKARTKLAIAPAVVGTQSWSSAKFTVSEATRLVGTPRCGVRLVHASNLDVGQEPA